jgi:hypothetical protein
MGLKVKGVKKTDCFKEQNSELQRYSLDELITFVYNKLQTHKEIKLSCIMIFLLQQIMFEQMRRITQ